MEGLPEAEETREGYLLWFLTMRGREVDMSTDLSVFDHIQQGLRRQAGGSVLRIAQCSGRHRAIYTKVQRLLALHLVQRLVRRSTV